MWGPTLFVSTSKELPTSGPSWTMYNFYHDSAGSTQLLGLRHKVPCINKKCSQDALRHREKCTQNAITKKPTYGYLSRCTLHRPTKRSIYPVLPHWNGGLCFFPKCIKCFDRAFNDFILGYIFVHAHSVFWEIWTGAIHRHNHCDFTRSCQKKHVP